MEEGATSQGIQATKETGKEMDFPLEATEGTSPVNTSETDLGFLISWIVREEICIV